MSRSIVLALLAAIGSAGPFESCYRIEYRVALMPDGSGKVEVLISQKLDNDELKQPFPLHEFAESMEGFAALTPAKEEVKAGWRHARFTVYFEDVNKLYYNSDGPRKGRCDGVKHDECLHFSLARRETGLTLTIEDWVFNKGPHRDPKENWEHVREDSANLLKWEVLMPGKATKVLGFQKMDGRRASYERSSETIKVVEDAVTWPVCARRSVECGKSEVADAEQTAFKKELTDAKAAWPKLEAHLKAERARKEAEQK